MHTLTDQITASMKIKSCNHLDQITEVTNSNIYECVECVKSGDQWVHLRTCQSCGITLCCDSSPNKHASQHFNETTHSVISSAEPGENWLWCYSDELFKRY